jgi:hypothetical protein
MPNLRFSLLINCIFFGKEVYPSYLHKYLCFKFLVTRINHFSLLAVPNSPFAEVYSFFELTTDGFVYHPSTTWLR